MNQKVFELLGGAEITDNWYDCTKEILSGLGQMYMGDVRTEHFTYLTKEQWLFYYGRC